MCIYVHIYIYICIIYVQRIHTKYISLCMYIYIYIHLSYISTLLESGRLWGLGLVLLCFTRFV